MATLQAMLDPQVLTRVVSQVAATSDWLTAKFGVAPGGPNVIFEGHGREGQYNIYDHTRKIAQGRAPGTAAARSAQQGMGKVLFTYPRMHDSVSLLAEQIHNLGKIENPAMRDIAGENMIKRQTNSIGEKAANWRKAQLIGAMRDSLYINKNGDDQYFTFAASTTGPRINFQMPAGNQSKLNMLGAGDIIDASWALNTTNIPLHIGKINAAFQQLCGGHLAAVMVDAVSWNRVITNNYVAAVHGTAGAPFMVLERDQLDPALGSTMKNTYVARLNVYPDIAWYVTDEGLDVGAPGSETFTKIIEAGYASFIGFDPGNSDVLACYEGSEPIAEYDGGPEVVKAGLNSWSVKRANPTSTDIFYLDNALIVNHVPKSMAYGNIIF